MNDWVKDPISFTIEWRSRAPTLAKDKQELQLQLAVADGGPLLLWAPVVSP